MFNIKLNCDNQSQLLFLQGYQQNEYIVTPMPLPKTMVDFWRLVRDFKVATIVKLNDCHATVHVCIFTKTFLAIRPLLHDIHGTSVYVTAQTPISLQIVTGAAPERDLHDIA